MVMIKMFGKKDRYDVISFALMLLLVFGYTVLRPWTYKTFPSTCPYASYLPDRSAVTKCVYSGIVDTSIDFEATGSRADMDVFLEEVVSDLKNPKIEITEGGLNGNDMPGHFHAYLSASDLTQVILIWHRNEISMSYRER